MAKEHKSETHKPAKAAPAPAPVGAQEVHKVIAEREERLKAKADEAAAAAPAPEKAKPAAKSDPSCAVPSPQLTARQHLKELEVLQRNLGERKLAELARKYPVVAALIQEIAALKAKSK